MRMLIVNPIAGCGYALKVMEQVQSVLTARNLPFRVMRTEYPGYAAKLAREAVEMGCEAVYVIGGDGTFSEAARGLAGSGIPIGLIPAGTGNDFVKTLGTPKEPMAALDFILSHEPRPCNAIDLNGQLFLNVAGAGFDVTVLENVADFGGKIRGLLPYLVGLIRAIWKHQPLQLTYTVDGKTQTKEALLCIAANGKWIGGGIPICPDAVPNDGEIDFMVVGHQPRWKVPYYLVRMMMKQILNFPFTEHVLCDKVTVSSPGMHVEVDGEIIACEAVKKSKKLLCSQVKIGNQVRQIVSGIRKHYSPEEMVGKKVMVVTNLKPATLAGVKSEGMILCAEDADGNLSLMVPEKKMPAGAEIC